MLKRHITWFVVLLAMAAPGGCTLFGSMLVPAGEVPDDEDGPPERSSQEVYECKKAKGISREGLNIADRNVIAVACGENQYGSSIASSRIGVEEFIFSEVDIDPVYHGIHLILCSQDAKAEKYYHIMEKCRLSYELASPQAFEASISAYPGFLPIDLATILWRYNQAALWISHESTLWAEQVDFNPREKEIFYDVPHAVLNEYIEHRGQYHDIYNFVSSFRSTFAYQPFGATVPADCAETLTQARAAYLERSFPNKDNAWDLMTRDLGYWITENMVLCYLGLKDYAGALAEAEILKAERREVAAFEKIYTAMAAEIVKDNEMEAKLAGNLGDAKGLIMPYKPTACSLDCLTPPSKMFAGGRPQWESQIQVLYPHVSLVRGEIESVKKKGDMATITWQGEKSSWESWSCYDTKAVDYITPEGYVVYREQCFKDLGVTTNRPPEVTLPSAETEGLEKGLMAAVVHDTADPSNSKVVFACQDLGGGAKRCTRVEQILFN